MSTFRMTLGAQLLGNGKARFRVWAPRRKTVEVAIEAAAGIQATPLERGPDGFFEGTAVAAAGTRYRYRLDGGEMFPDPCSRSQPEGPHGPSEVIDPSFPWTDAGWKGPSRTGAVLYELHVGTFTQAGTFDAVASQLPYLKELGVTTLELMPVAAFPGRCNWGYDGVNLFAPCAVYGRPDALRRLVDACHRQGLGIILDVVYNHLGPDGNYLAQYTDQFFSTRHPGEWGQAINFDGEGARPVRDFFLQNAAYWISEFHFDGLRLDATQALVDDSPRHIIAELTEQAREAAGDRNILVVAESEPQDVTLVTDPALGGRGCDAVWVDDFHHAARVAATGRSEAYFSDYRGTATELLACVRHNSLYQGQWSQWQKQPRGNALRTAAAERVVFYLQNHDQVANQLKGERLDQLANASTTRALTTCFLLLPQTPMLFMGQEFAASAPFLYFTDHGKELAEKVRLGRQAFLSQFPSIKAALEEEGFRPVQGQEAFERSKLDLTERERPRHAAMLALHRDLLRMRREDPVFAARDPVRVDGGVLSERALFLRFFGDDHGDRLVILNLGPELACSPCPQPLSAPIPGRSWRYLLSSEETRFGGRGAAQGSGQSPWVLPGSCALVLSSEEARP